MALSSIPGLGRSPGGGHDDPLQYSCLEHPHEQRSLAGYSPWGRKESGATEWLSTAQPSVLKVTHHTNKFFTFFFILTLQSPLCNLHLHSRCDSGSATFQAPGQHVWLVAAVLGSSDLEPCYPRWVLGTSSLSSIWELIWIAESQAHPRPIEVESAFLRSICYLLEWEASVYNPHVQSPPLGFWFNWSKVGPGH